MKKPQKKTWIYNQIIICLFGLFMSLNGYSAFSSRFYRDEHFRITLDLGEHHELYGLVLIVSGVVIFAFGIVNFRKLRDYK